MSYICIEYILPCSEGVNGSTVGPRPNKSAASFGRGGWGGGGGAKKGGGGAAGECRFFLVVFAPRAPHPRPDLAAVVWGPGPGPAKNQVIEISCPKAIIDT